MAAASHAHLLGDEEIEEGVMRILRVIQDDDHAQSFLSLEIVQLKLGVDRDCCWERFGTGW